MTAMQSCARRYWRGRGVRLVEQATASAALHGHPSSPPQNARTDPFHPVSGGCSLASYQINTIRVVVATMKAVTLGRLRRHHHPCRNTSEDSQDSASNAAADDLTDKCPNV